MHRVLVIVFDNGAKAGEGKAQLLQLDSEGVISIYGYVVIAKTADGTVLIPQADGHGTVSPFATSLLGSLADSASPTPEGAPAKSSNPADSSRTETGRDFTHDVTAVLLPNRVAIVAEIEEEWPPVLDRRMEPIGGIVFRWTVSEAQHAIEM